MQTTNPARTTYTSPDGRIRVEYEPREPGISYAGSKPYALFCDDTFCGYHATSGGAEAAGLVWLEEQAAQLAVDLADEAADAAEKIRQSDFWSEQAEADADLIAAAGGISANPYRSRIWFDEIQIIERATGRYAAAYSRFDHTAPTCREYWLRELRQRLCEREGLSEYAGPWPCEISGGMVVRRVNWGS